MARLARDHEDLTSVVSFVRDEVGQHVADVERKISPHISLGRRDLIFVTEASFRRDSIAMPLRFKAATSWR
jgi:hypothetical protein